ncbi:MAG: Tad domain-containing protein, partial [Chloroflexota bacterium]
MKLTLLRRAKEGGQAIVLIALLMVILIASVGLAIDGGGMFLLYRDIQNATDSAGLSAAYALCTEGDPIVQAMRTAELNGFDNNDPNTTVTITRTTDAATSEELIVVDITAEKPSYFIQVIYPGPLIVSSQTTAFCRRTAGASSDIVNRYALRSLAQPGECTDSAGWTLNGTRFT